MLAGLEAYDEDHIDTLAWTASQTASLRSLPDHDTDRIGQIGASPGTLGAYRMERGRSVTVG